MDAALGRRIWTGLAFTSKAFGGAAVIAGFVLWAHFGSDLPVFRSKVSAEPGWEGFRAAYHITDFGEDGHFVRAAQNGYNVFYASHKYAWRFTRKTAKDAVKYQESPKDGQKCADCNFFQAPGSCTVVDGTISPNGWCMLYSKKS